MKRIRFCAEAAYLAGILFMAFGVACVSRSNFGYSMMVAPVYLIYQKLSPYLSFLTFGMTEYLFQGLLILVLALVVRRFRLRYFLSFVTAVIYGFVFDGALWLVSFVPAGGIFGRILWFAVGEFGIALAVMLFMHTYLAPEAYELFVKEVSLVYRKPFPRVKLFYDLGSLVFAVILSFSLFGAGAFRDFSWGGFFAAVRDGFVIEGIGLGTVAAAFLNGPLIGLLDRTLGAHLDFTPCVKRAREAQESGGENCQESGEERPQ